MSGIFPFVTEEDEDDEPGEELPVYKEWAYDMENNRFLTRAGRMYLVEKNEALRIWIYKALNAQRFRYPAYTSDYGHELEDLVGDGDEPEIWESEAERVITEALIVNPYIQAVEDFDFDYSGELPVVQFTVATVYDALTYEMEVYNE